MINFKLKFLVFSALMTALTAIGSYLLIPLPFSPVPITLQTFFTLFAGLIGGKKVGLTSQLVYLLIGSIGLPIFAGGTGGIGILFSPTGGFLLSFPIAAYITGTAKNMSSPYKITGILAAATSLIYLSGVIFMIIGWDFSPAGALTAGVVPFIPGDIFKIIILIILNKRLNNLSFIRNLQ
ncbi:MAG: biotin transporter BioY [Bacillota bacterium]